jgi:uncharacterized protein YbbC (DUF1343 family)
MRTVFRTSVFILFFVVVSCNIFSKNRDNITPGAYNIEEYRTILKDKKVAVVANHTSLIGETHLVDSLLSVGINVVSIFSPEHGFRGNAGAGEYVDNGVDIKTGLPLISLYGKNKKPTKEQLKGVDCVVFDIQDVGVRFYTYLSTMHYVMEACAENNVECVILDRPNPNGFYVDGPVLDTAYRSFVGMHKIPLIHGMTLGELAMMINGEGWLKAGVKCDIKVIKCKNYDHTKLYELPVKPSPNLPNMTSVYLYPSLALFEGTVVSVGRGTDFPFQTFGHPEYKYEFTFTPRSIKGVSMHPKHKGKVCHGIDLRDINTDSIINNPGLNIEWLYMAYNAYGRKDKFFNKFIRNLYGSQQLEKDILDGKTPDQIKLSWHDDILMFEQIRKKYLLYPDFDK